MKYRTVVIAVIFSLTIQFATAQSAAAKFTSEDQKVRFASKNLLTALHSDNPGVIESAMRVTSQMKLQYPAADVTELVKQMAVIFKTHPAGAVRYKAYVAMSVCENPEWYAQRESVVNGNEETFYRAASVRMQEQLLSVNNQ